MCVHDDGASYVGNLNDIILDEDRELWMQCQFDSIEDEAGNEKTVEDHRVSI